MRRSGRSRQLEALRVGCARQSGLPARLDRWQALEEAARQKRLLAAAAAARQATIGAVLWFVVAVVARGGALGRRELP